VAGALVVAGPASSLECGALQTSSGEVRYCIKRFNQAQNPDVLYYFHGALMGYVSDPALSAQTATSGLVDVWRAAGIIPPTIVTVSWGARWLLKGIRLTALEREVIPAIDSIVGSPGKRLVLGASIGGLNAYLAWSRLPHLFARAGFQCPAFFSFNPITDPQSRRRIAERLSAPDWQWWRPWRHRASLKIRLDALTSLAWAFEQDVTAADDWREFDPASTVHGVARAPAHVVFDSRDQYPFSPGYELAKVGYRVTYEKIIDNHCNRVNTVGLARFLAREAPAARNIDSR